MTDITPEEARAARGTHTQQDMASALGVSRRTITYWECTGIPHSPAALVYRAILNGVLTL